MYLVDELVNESIQYIHTMNICDSHGYLLSKYMKELD